MELLNLPDYFFAFIILGGKIVLAYLWLFFTPWPWVWRIALMWVLTLLASILLGPKLGAGHDYVTAFIVSYGLLSAILLFIRAIISLGFCWLGSVLRTEVTSFCVANVFLLMTFTIIVIAFSFSYLGSLG